LSYRASDSMFLSIDFVRVTNCFYDYDYDYDYDPDKQTDRQTNKQTDVLENPTHADRHSWRG